MTTDCIVTCVVSARDARARNRAAVNATNNGNPSVAEPVDIVCDEDVDEGLATQTDTDDEDDEDAEYDDDDDADDDDDDADDDDDDDDIDIDMDGGDDPDDQPFGFPCDQRHVMVVGMARAPRSPKVRKNPYVKTADEAYHKYSSREMAHFWNMSDADKEHVTETERVIRAHGKDDVPLRFKVLGLDIDPRMKALALQKIDGMRSESSSDKGKTLQYINALCRLPVGKYDCLCVGPSSPIGDIQSFLHNMQERLDQRVYGHVDAKAHIIRLVAQWAMNPSAKGLVLGFHGHMGCGKTQLAMAVCESLGMPFGFIPLGGCSDAAYLDGHSFTYEGAIWGKIADVLMHCGCSNPVLFFDELDKVVDSTGGRQVINLLIHLTDPTQNDKFSDRYFMGVDIDLSRACVILSYNDPTMVNPVLRDRIVEIPTQGYSLSDKVKIATKHLLPTVRADFGLQADDLVMDDNVLRRVVDVVAKEEGVRGLQRAIRDIAGSVNLGRLMNDGTTDASLRSPVAVTCAMVDEFVRTGRRDAVERGLALTHSMYM